MPWKAPLLLSGEPMLKKIKDNLFKSHVIGKFFGIELKLHWTFSLLVLYMLVSSTYHDGAFFALKNAAKYLILFGCVTIHEYCHCLVARKYGVGTKDILLTFIGGIARIEKDVEDPRHELKVAWAGPLSNIILCGISFVAYKLTNIHAFEWAAVINLGLFIFNMVPAYPMDGGRIFKATMVLYKGEKKGTKIALYVALIFFALFLIGSFTLKDFNLGVVGGLGVLITLLQLKHKEETKDMLEKRKEKLRAYGIRLKEAKNDLEGYDIAKEVFEDENITLHDTCFILNAMVGGDCNSCGPENCKIPNCSIPELRLNTLFNRANQFTIKEMQACLEDIRKG